MRFLRDALGRFAGSGGGKGRAKKGGAKRGSAKKGTGKVIGGKNGIVVGGKPPKAWAKRNPQPGSKAFERRLRKGLGM